MECKHQLLAGLVGACLMLVLPTARCRAATTIAVNSNSDTGTTSSCVLRDAIIAANTNTTTNGCTVGGGGAPFTIEFSVAGTVTLGTTLPPITSNVTITGFSAASSSETTIDGGSSVELMVVDSGANVSLQFLTLTHGAIPNTGGGGSGGNGGAISNAGTLSVTNCTFSGNSVGGGNGSSSMTGDGGAIFNTGSLHVTNSTFSQNGATGGNGPGVPNGTGGGIFNDGGTLTITNSTFSGNQATGGIGGGGDKGDGGGIFNDGGTLTITNSTFSGNQALGGSGGSGTAGEGGGVFNDGGTVNLNGTILAASTGGNCGGGVTDNGYNLSDDASCAFSQMTSQNSASNIDLAAAPADNGGPTETLALTSANSAAVDKIPAAMCPATDQRGVTRPDNGEASCDSGAYEFQDPPPPFAGTPGAANCNGQTVSALSQQFGTLDAAAAALGFPSVKALQSAIKAFCAG
jgi:hypothetical protein